ncbi:protein phosphatase 1 regulatory subunit 15B [Pogona vitticeps]
MEPRREREQGASRFGACPPSLPQGQADAPFSLLRLLSQLLQRLLPSPVIPLFWLQSEAHVSGPESSVPVWGAPGLAPLLAVQHQLRFVSSSPPSSVLTGADKSSLSGPLTASWEELSEVPCMPSKLPEILQQVHRQETQTDLEVPDPDCGYHSLEVEEQPLDSWAPKDTAACREEAQELQDHSTPCGYHERGDLCEEGSTDVRSSTSEDSDIEEDLSVEARPVCSNKLIDYILGGACSGEESEGEEDWDEDKEDDDGFDSEGSLSESDTASQDGESIHLWNSFCSLDPYDPRNFTAAVQTSGCAPEKEPITDSNEPEEIEDSSSWSESSCEEDEWESGSVDESENLKLWNSFSNLGDPYNPFNFKAQFQTAEKKGKCDLKGPPCIGLSASKRSVLFSCEVRLLDNQDFEVTENVKYGILSREKCVKKKKKVTFLEEVTEYYVSNEEDRKGPWEELARDGCRFHKRIQEIEAAIGYCLTVEHRQQIFNRLQERLDVS